MVYLSRYLVTEIEKWLDRREIIAIKGPRQSGKTTLLKILKDYLLRKKKVDSQQIIYITFEDRDILEDFSKNPKAFIESFISKKSEKRYYFLLDEFQYLNDGGQKLKLLYDLYENAKFIITGSSSLELTQATAKYLVGRIFSFCLYQFSFGEFLKAKSEHIFNIYMNKSDKLMRFIGTKEEFEIEDVAFEKDIYALFEEYVRFGGYPEVIKTRDEEAKRIILKNIYDTYITKDIVGLLKIGDVTHFRDVVRCLSTQIGALLNYHSLASDTDSYFKQIKHYLSILEETYIIRQTKPYFTNKITELKKNPKIYFVDSGLRNFIVNNFNKFEIRTDIGSLVENFVLSQFFQYKEKEIKYWRTIGKAEVDFILVNSDNKIIPVEVKFSSMNKPIITRGFRNFINEYGPERAVVLTKRHWDKIKIEKTEIVFAPVWCIGK